MMKKLLLAGLATLSFAGCSKNDDAKPAAASLVGGTWTLTSQTIVVTPKGGGTSTTYTQRVVPNTVKLTYLANGNYHVYFDKSISATGTTTTTDGTYTYSGNTITYLINNNTSTARVDVLTSTNLTHVATSEDVAGTQVNVTTNTYTR
jgi:hypothetical protein